MLHLSPLLWSQDSPIGLQILCRLASLVACFIPTLMDHKFIIWLSSFPALVIGEILIANHKPVTILVEILIANDQPVIVLGEILIVRLTFIEIFFIVVKERKSNVTNNKEGMSSQ